MATGADLRGPEITPYPGTGPITDALWLAQSVATGKSHSATSDRLPGGSGILPYVQTFRFRTRAEANGNYGGQVLAEIDYSTLYTFSRQIIENWRDDPTNLTSPTSRQETIAVYDPNAPASRKGWRTAGAAATGDQSERIGLQLVKLSDPAATGVLKYEPDPAEAVEAQQLRYYDDGQGVAFYEALQTMSSPVPAPVRGTTTAYWKPTDSPGVPGGTQSGGLPYHEYTVQESDVANGPREVVITVPGASSFGVVGVSQPGVSGFDPITPNEDYSGFNDRLTISAALDPPLQAGDKVHIFYTTGSASGGSNYTDTQARAAQLNRVAGAGTTTITLTSEAAFDYGTLASGTFTIDATNCVPGKLARFAVGSGASAPNFTNAPAGQPFKFIPGNIYATGNAFSYSLLVCADRIEVVILAD